LLFFCGMSWQPSELILNGDGSIYHLKMMPGDLADTIVLVGDPDRVDRVSALFDSVEIRKSNREFVSHTGTYRQQRITVLSTGIGTDNVDIVLNELDALANLDLAERRPRPVHKSLRLVRIGTTGGLQPDIPIGSYILSRYAAGFDAVLNFYAGRNKVADLAMEDAFKKHTNWPSPLPRPYFVRSSDDLFGLFPAEMIHGITVSAPGFYGPQGRMIRLQPLDPLLNSKLESFRYRGLRITNYEMESSALFGLAKLLGHQAVTLCAMIANRATREFTEDYKGDVDKLIKFTLEHLCPDV
jgi:uridine phosphorylase